MKYAKQAAAWLLSAILLCSCQAQTEAPTDTEPDTSQPKAQYTTAESDNATSPRTPATVDLASSVKITLNGTSAQISGSGASVESGVITISEGGTYAVSGTLADGRILVDAKGGNVTLVLNGADITCSTGSPIYIYQSALTSIYVMEDTENTLTDGSIYTFSDSRSSAEEDEPNACLYSKSDLVLQGEGSLVVNGNYRNGITGKDALQIYDLDLTVNAVGNGINGKDSNTIDSASITVKCGEDAIRSTNDTDESLGWISISNSVLDLTAGEDGIQAETAVTLSSGTYTISSGGGSAVQPSDDISAKGIKAGSELKLLNGVYVLDCSDDAVHSNGNVTVEDGKYTVSSGDDAFHADETLTVSGGQIDILASYEGLEGVNVDVSGGTIRLASDDDGINAGGGQDGSGFGGAGRGNTFGTGASAYAINISGGYLVIRAGGDGLDSNGSIDMTAGTVLVSSTGGGDGALDYNSGFALSGGTLLAVGSGGMPSAPSAAEQPVIYIGFESVLEAGSLVAFTGEEQQYIYEMPIRTANLVFSSPELKPGDTYTVSTGGTCTGAPADGVFPADASYSGGTVLTELTLTQTITRYGNTVGGFGNNNGVRGDMQPGAKPQRPADGTMPIPQNGQQNFQKAQ